MNCQMDDDELVEHLKYLPDFPMKPESKNKMLKELVRMEQVIKPRKMRGVSMQRVLGTALASSAGIALFTAGIMGYSHFGSQRGALPNTSTSKPPTSTHAVQPTYFGYHVPFRPLIPTKMAPGYKLTYSGISMTYSNGRTQFSSFVASYRNPKVPTQGRITVPPMIDVYEKYGDSVTQYQPIGNEQVKWTEFAQIDHQTYYSSGTKLPFANAIVFVKDNVIYAVDLPMGGKISERTLLGYAESITRLAPIQSVTVLAMGYKNALGAITFRPFVPSTLYSKYKDQEIIGSTVMKDSKGTTQWIDLYYNLKSNPRKGFMVTEGPLNNAENQIPFTSDVAGYSPTWKDFKRGLELRLGGNTSSPEFHRVLDLFRSSK